MDDTKWQVQISDSNTVKMLASRFGVNIE